MPNEFEDRAHLIYLREMKIDTLSRNQRKSFPALMKWWEDKQRFAYRLHDLAMIFGSAVVVVVIEHLWK
jgi:hypothetical protein